MPRSFDVQAPTEDDDAQAALVSRLTALAADADARAARIAADASAAADAAAGAAAAAEEEAVALAAAKAARLAKEYRSWEPRVGEYDACPQAPPHSGVLPYFASEEGLRAAKADPNLTGGLQAGSGALLPRRDTRSAAAAFSTIGVYRAAGDEMLWDAALDKPADSAHGTAPPNGSPVARPASEYEDAEAAQAEQARSTAHERPIDLEPAQQSGSAGSLKLPSIYKQPRAATELNDAYLAREYATMRLNKTASAALVRARGRDGAEFALGCERIDFGEVARGSTVARRVPLQNVSLATSRFCVDQAAPPLRLVYPRAAVPAGLKVLVTVELAPGRLQELGAFQTEVVVRSALNVIRCPVSSVFVEAPEAPSAQLGPAV